MCQKEWKMGTMVERIQPVDPSNLLNNMAQVFANTGNTPLPSNLRTPKHPNARGQNRKLGQAQIMIFLLRFYGIFLTILRRFFIISLRCFGSIHYPTAPCFHLFSSLKIGNRGKGRAHLNDCCVCTDAVA